MPIKRGTIVEFIGAAHDTHHLFKERQIKEFFDKYGLQVGDQGKIWEGYRGSWIRITWTRRDGTKAHRVSMRSGNFKIIEEPEKSDSDSDSVPELESNEDPVVDSPPVASQETMINSLRVILKSVRAENRELKEQVDCLNAQINVTRAQSDQEIIELHELAASRADQIDGLLSELDIIKLSHGEMSVELEKINQDLWEQQEDATRRWLEDPDNYVRIPFSRFKSGQTSATDTKSSDVCDEWARDQITALTKAMSNQAQIGDTQQKVIQNLKSKLDEIVLHESQTNELSAFCCQALKVNGMIVGKDDNERIVNKDTQDKAARWLQDISKKYLIKKRECDELGDWVVPEVGSG